MMTQSSTDSLVSGIAPSMCLCTREIKAVTFLQQIMFYLVQPKFAAPGYHVHEFFPFMVI